MNKNYLIIATSFLFLMILLFVNVDQGLVVRGHIVQPETVVDLPSPIRGILKKKIMDPPVRVAKGDVIAYVEHPIQPTRIIKNCKNCEYLNSELEAVRYSYDLIKKELAEKIKRRNSYYELAKEGLVEEQKYVLLDEDIGITKRNLEDLGQRLSSIYTREINQTIVATDEMQVIQLIPKSIGSMVNEGEIIAKLVPLHEAMEVEVYVPSTVKAYIHDEDPVQIKLIDINAKNSPIVHGKVRFISAVNLEEDRKDLMQGMSSLIKYKVRVQVDKNSLVSLPSHQLPIPGKEVEVLFKTGERSIVTALLGPFISSMKIAFVRP